MTTVNIPEIDVRWNDNHTLSTGTVVKAFTDTVRQEQNNTGGGTIRQFVLRIKRDTVPYIDDVVRSAVEDGLRNSLETLEPARLEVFNWTICRDYAESQRELEINAIIAL